MTLPRPRLHVFIATSLDGYIAREDGRIDWLEAANQRVPAGEDCGYAAFIAGVDALLMGRGTYESVLGFPQWPYGELPVYVASSRLAPGPLAVAGRAEALPGSPRVLLDALAARGHREVYLDGGRLAQAFLAEGLVDTLTVTRIPVLIGRGRPLFADAGRDIALELLRGQDWPFGFSQQTYRVLPAPPAAAGS